MIAPTVLSFFDKDTKSYSYVVADERAGACAVIDSVLDFDLKSGRTSTESADALVAAVKKRGWRTAWVLETHAHADHLTAAPYVKAQLGGKLGIGANIPTVQETFRAIYNLGADFASDGRQFDRLFADGEEFQIGGLTAHVMATPGHTPACITYVVGDAVFIGDTMFAPDYGTARCDFPGGDARQLYRSIQRILNLPPERVVGTYFVDSCNAIKISIDRPTISASMDERDVFGAQQQAAIESMSIPIHAAVLAKASSF